VNTSTNRRLRPTLTAKASTSADGLVLLDVNGGLVLASNLVGARIWQLIEQRNTAAEIARQLVIEYGVSDHRANGDVAAFIAALADRGLVSEDATS
jgi:hypothetical protein